MMPKINVYLPDDLAEAVKDAGIPVSAICQRALEQAVRRISAIRSAVLGDLSAEDLAARLPSFTERARTTLRLAAREARERGVPEVGTEHLLHGILAEGGNLALQVLNVLEIQPDRLAEELARVPAAATPDGEEPGRRFSAQAASALELTVTEAIAMKHNYVGCEHLLVGIAAEPDGAAGAALRTLGADAPAVRRAVSAAVAGYAHLRAQAAGSGPAPAGSGPAPAGSVPAGSVPAGPAPAGEAMRAALRGELAPLVKRIERLEAAAGIEDRPAS